MQRKNWILLINIFAIILSVFHAEDANSQVTFNINAGNIKQGSLTLDNATTSYTQLLSVAPTIYLSTSSSTLTPLAGGTGISTNLITARIIGDGGSSTNILNNGNVQTINLSTTAQTIYGSVLGLLSSGAITLRYTIPNLAGTLWKSGSYSTTLNFGTSGVNIGYLSPTTATINVNVAAFINALISTSGSLQLHVTSLEYYRSTPISTTQNVDVITTVPYGIRVKAAGSQLTYTNGYSGATDPLAATGLMQAQLTLPLTGAAVSTSATFNNLTPTGGYNVPTGNEQISTTTFSISPANLKSSFIQKGTYNTIINYEVFDASSSAQAVTQSLSSALTVTVDDIAELKVNQADINLNYTTTDNYTNGVYADMLNHLTLSKTTPFDVYVTAGSTTLTNGSNNIPVNIISLLPMPNAPASFNTIVLSNSPQKIFSAAQPVVDKVLNVRYAIPAANTKQLLGKPAGVYTTTITYSMIAP